jgi:hypothetical protein
LHLDERLLVPVDLDPRADAAGLVDDEPVGRVG